MPKIYAIILFFFVFLNFNSYAQKKSIRAKSITENIIVDGKIPSFIKAIENHRFWERKQIKGIPA